MDYRNELFKIVDNYIKKNKLEKYLYDIKFSNNSNKTLSDSGIAGYNCIYKYIEFNTDKIKYDKDNYENLIALIYHELVHVKQQKVRKENNFTIEKQLYDYEYRLVIWKHKIYDLYYKYMSIEYNANIEGIINTCDYLNIKLNNSLYNHINNYYIDYEKNKLYELYMIRRKLKKFNKMISECNYEEPKKLLLGLPINENTYKKILIKDNSIFNDMKKYVL